MLPLLGDHAAAAQGGKDASSLRDGRAFVNLVEWVYCGECTLQSAVLRCAGGAPDSGEAVADVMALLVLAIKAGADPLGSWCEQAIYDALCGMARTAAAAPGDGGGGGGGDELEASAGACADFARQYGLTRLLQLCEDLQPQC